MFMATFSKRHKIMRALLKHKLTYFLLLPAFLFMAITIYYPLIMGFLMSFQHYNFAAPAGFAGFGHYIEILGDVDFWRAFKNTLILGGGSMLACYLSQLIAAILLNELTSSWFRRITQTVTYLPDLFSWVAVGGIWISLLAPDTGFVNDILRFFGQEPIAFMTKSAFVVPIYILLNVWKTTGYGCIIFLVAIISVDQSLFEAAQIDGAGRLKQITHIMLPSISGALKSVFLLNLLSIFKTFDQSYIMSNPAIVDEIEVLMTYTYKIGIKIFRFDYASAVAMIVVVLTALLLLLKNRLMPETREGA